MALKIIHKIINRIIDPKPLLRRFYLQFYADKIYIEQTSNRVLKGPFSGLDFSIAQFTSRVEKISIAKLELLGQARDIMRAVVR